MKIDRNELTILSNCDSNDIIGNIAKIERECFILDHWSSNMIIESCKNPNNMTLVVIYKDTIIAYSIISIVLDESEILSIGVLPKYQNYGIATNLLKYIISYLKNINVNTIFLEVRKSNIAAINLYKKLNFIEYNIRKSYYKKPVEDAILMKANI